MTSASEPGGTVVWISGASSGIGAALASSVPYDDARVIGINRRPPARGEHVEADLADPREWPGIAGHFESVLRRGAYGAAVFLHLSAGATPIADRLCAAAERGELATPEATASQIWDLVLDGKTHGSAVPVGAVPAELRGA